MLVLKILAASVVLLLAVGALGAFEAQVSKRYGARFLTKPAAVAWIAAAAMLLGGHYWWHSAIESGGDQLDGILLMGVGAVVMLGSLAWNIRRTNVLFGVVGTLLQASIFSVLAFFGVIGAGVFLIVFFAAALGARPVYVINAGAIRRR